MRVAYLTSADMVPGRPGNRGDLFELELQLASLRPACRDRGIELELRVWEDPELRGDDYDAVVVGTTWDYHDKVEAFLARLEALALHCPVLNPPEVIRWNAHKGYLLELGQRGLPVVPSLRLDRVDPAEVERACALLGADEVVVKPIVGAGAARQVRIRRGQALPPPGQCPPGVALVQPFLPAAQLEGEYSFVFLGGALSHALVKRPASGDYRVQSIYGGTEQPVRVGPDELALARAVLAAVAGDLLYARVDMMRGPGGGLLLMELELIEPYLYPQQGPELGPRFADALLGQV